jgi:hypothetical protein
MYKKKTEGFEKTQEDDLRSMGEGLIRPKGRVHFGFGEPIDAEIDLIDKSEPVQNQIERIAELIDEQVYRNFRLWPNNFVAEDILNGTKNNTAEYTEEQYAKFEAMLDEAVETIPGDSAEIRQMFLQMYVNPIVNKRKTDQ